MTICFGAITKAVLPRILGVENIGIIYFADSIAMITFSLLSLGVIAYVNRRIPHNPKEITEIYSSIFGFTFLWGLILWLGIFAYVLWRGEVSEKSLVILLIAVFHLLQSHNAGVVKPMFLAADQVNFISRINIISKGLQTAIICGGAFFIPSLVWVGVFFICSELLTSLFLLIRSFRLGWVRFNFDRKMFFAAVAVGFPFLLNQTMVSIYGQIDIAFMEFLSNPKEIGWYGSAQKLKGLFLMGVPLIYSAILPMLSRSYKEGTESYEKFLSTIFAGLLFMSFGMSLSMSLLSPELVGILFGDEFNISIKHVSMLAPVLLFTYINVLLGANLTLSSTGKLLNIVTITSIGMNASLNLYFIPMGLEHFGPGGAGIGAATTTIIAEAFVFIMMILMTPVKLMNWKNAVFCLASYLALSATIFYQVSSSPDLMVRLQLLGALVVILSGAFALANGKDLLEFKNKLRKS